MVVAGSFISILEVGWWKRDVSGACCLETDERARHEEDQVLEAGYRGKEEGECSLLNSKSARSGPVVLGTAQAELWARLPAGARARAAEWLRREWRSLSTPPTKATARVSLARDLQVSLYPV